MSLDTTTLAQARSKFEDATVEEDWPTAEASLREALGLANDGLVAARRANDAAAKLQALELVAQCNMYLGDLFAANLAVTDELAMIRRSKDAKAEIRCLQLAAEVHSSRGDGHGAVEALQNALDLVKQNPQERAAQAKTLCQLSAAKLAVGKQGEALAPAQDAMKLFQELGDEVGEKEARRNVNVVYAARKQLDKAPDRAEALQALKDLATAAESRNSLAWGSAMETLHRTGAFSQQDIDEVASKALETDRYNAAVFLEEQGVAVASGGGLGGGQMIISEYPKTLHYVAMRVGGLGYGPRFRCGQFVGRKAKMGDPDSRYATACLQCSEAADDWEQVLQFHPGILDSMLQSSNVMAIPIAQ